MRFGIFCQPMNSDSTAMPTFTTLVSTNQTPKENVWQHALDARAVAESSVG